MQTEPTPEQTKRHHVVLTTEQSEKINDICKRTGASMSFVIRRSLEEGTCLDDYLQSAAVLPWRKRPFKRLKKVFCLGWYVIQHCMEFLSRVVFLPYQDPIFINGEILQRRPLLLGVIGMIIVLCEILNWGSCKDRDFLVTITCKQSHADAKVSQWIPC